MFNLPNIFTNKKREHIVNGVALDIGTEVIKAVLFDTNAHGVTVKKVARINQQQNAMSKGVIKNLDTVLENCRLAFNQLNENLLDSERPEDVILGVAGEYIQGVSILVNYEREDRFDKEVTENEQERIFKKVHKQIEESGKDDLAQRTGLVNEDIEILHITVTGMEIGGMKVDSLIGYRGKEVKIHFYASFAPKTYTSALRAVTKSLKLNFLGVVSQPFAVARGYAGATEKDFSGIFIDIGGGTTDIAIVEKGTVVDTQMFAFGGRVFTKELATELNLDYRHAEQRKIKYTEGELDDRIKKQLKNIIYPVAKLWMSTLKSALEINQDLESYPTKIYLCGGGALLPEIKEVMIEFPWTKLLPFATVPKIEIIYPSKLGNLVDLSSELIYTYDITPASLSLYAYDKISNPTIHNK